MSLLTNNSSNNSSPIPINPSEINNIVSQTKQEKEKEKKRINEVAHVKIPSKILSKQDEDAILIVPILPFKRLRKNLVWIRHKYIYSCE